jgi:hypothetical protein
MAASVRMPAEEDLRSLLRGRLGDGPAGAVAVRLDDDLRRLAINIIPEGQQAAAEPIFLAYSLFSNPLAIQPELKVPWGTWEC